MAETDPMQTLEPASSEQGAIEVGGGFENLQTPTITGKRTWDQAVQILGLVLYKRNLIRKL